MHREVEAGSGSDSKARVVPAPTPRPRAPRNDLTGLAAPSEPARGSPLRLFRFERRWLCRVFESVLPAGADPGLPLGARDVPMGRFLDDLLARAPLLTVIGLRGALWLVMLAPLALLRRPRTFLGLDPATRAALLDRLRHSDRYMVRESVTLLKIIACLGFGGLAPVQQHLGIHPTDDTPPDWARGPR